MSGRAAPIRMAVFTGPGRLAVAAVPEPRLAAGEALVEVLGCTLCGSDLHSFTGRRSVPVPTVLGHEVVGRVVRLGPSGPRGTARDMHGEPLAVGERVAWGIVASCGQCPRCRRGLPQKCVAAVKYGHATVVAGREPLGGLASHCLLVANASIVRLPDSLPLEVACPAGCATATVAAALEPAGSLAGGRVGVFGLGMLGLTGCAMAREAGATEVVGIDPDPVRAAWATRFGATRTGTPGDLAGLLEQVAPGGLDVVLEMSGAPMSVAVAIESCGVGAAVHLVGSVFPAGCVLFDPEHLVRRQATVRGIHNYAPRHLAQAVEFLEAGHDRYPFAELVNAWHPLAGISAAFRSAIDSRAIRIGVRP